LQTNYLAPIRTDINSIDKSITSMEKSIDKSTNSINNIEKSISSMKTYWKIFVGVVITAGSSCILFYIVSLIVLLQELLG